MNKKKFSVIALVLLVVMAISALVLAACNPDDTPADTSSDTEATEGLLISNSDFKVIGTSGDFPRSVTSWSGARLYSSSAVHEDVIAGAVNLSSATYEQYRHLWDDEDGALYKLLTADGRYGENDAIKNALMIYMPEENETGDEDYGPTAYGYTSASFSVEKNAYYKLSVDVLTYGIAGDPDNEDADPGARIYVSSATYAEFAGINTDGKWVTYEIYIEGGVSSSSSLTVNLSLGKYSSYYSDGLTTGYAFFDNVTLEKLTDDEGGKTAAEKYADATAREKDQYEAEKNDPAAVRTVATASLKLTNGGFEFGSTSIASSTAPSGWSMVRGDSAPSSDRFNGIVSLSSFEEDYADFVSSSYYIKDGDSVVRYYPAEQLAGIADSVVSRDGVMGDNVYMLSQQLMTAQGIRTSRDIVIEKNKYYILSVDVYLANIYGAGMTLRLTGSGNDIEITGIASNPTGDDNAVVYGSPEQGKSTAGWTTFTFVIHGNSYRDMSYKMEMWLGTDTPSDNTETTYTRYTSTTSSGSSQKTYTTGGTFSTGWAFIDDLTLEETDEAGFDGVSADGTDFTLDAAGDTTAKTLKIDLATANLFSDGSGISGGFKPAGSSSGDLDLSGDTLGIPEGFTYAPSDEDDPALVDPEFATAGSINTADGSGLPEGAENPGLPYDTESSYAFMLDADKATSFAYDSAKFTIRPNTSYRISVWVKTADIESGTGAYVYLRQSDDKNEGEVKDLASFTAVNTDELEDNNGWRELTLLVRGNADEAKELWLTLALGTGGRYAASTLTRGTVFFANMSMTEVTPADYDDTTTGTYVKKVSLASSKTYSFANGGFDNVDLEETEGLATGGVALQDGDQAGVPEDWTLSSDILGDSFVGGIVKMNADGTVSKQVSNSLFPNDTDFFTGLYANADDLIKAGAPSVLVLAGKDGEAFNAGFTSDSFSLSASSVCSVSVWAKAEAGTKGMIYLATEASGSERDGKQVWFEITGDGEWHRYTFNIRVGLTSVSLELGLWLGENADITGAVIGDDADAGQVTEESLASSGIIVFDSVTMNSGLTDDDFTDGSADDYSRYIDFYSDGFDTLSDSEEDRSELTDPDGWTEVVGTDQESSNTTSGVLYLDRDGGFVEMDGDYLAMFGAEFDLEDFVIDQSEVDAVKNNPEYPEYAGMSDDKISDALRQKKYDALKAATGVTWDDILPEAGVQPDGNRILVINNTANSAFYYRSSGYTLSADKSYEISVKVYTHGIGHIDLDTLKFDAADDGGAFVELYLGSTYNNDSDPLRVENINLSEEDGWTTVTFYVTAPSENVSGVQLRMGLGTYDAEDENKLLSGYAFFDTVTFREITSAEYQAAADDIADGTLSSAFNVARTVPDAPESGDTTVDNDPEVPDDDFNLDNLWWMIPTILLGVAIVAVVIVYFVRKYKKKFVKKTDDTVPADKEDTANVARKKSNYEDFGE